MMSSSSFGSATGTPMPARSHSGLWRAALGFAGLALTGAGLLYPLAGVGLGQVAFHAAANGSILMHEGRAVGSMLVAQPFAADRYFQPRPSAAGYDPMALAGSNQARSHPALAERIEATRAQIAQRERVDPADVPADLLTQSGSGTDPHISPAAARIQVVRVAAARGMTPAQVQRVVDAQTEPPSLGVLGEARVNVLALNLALEASPAGRPHP